MSIFNSGSPLLGPEQIVDCVVDNSVDALAKAKSEGWRVTSFELDKKDLAALIEGKALKLTGFNECFFIEFKFPLRIGK